MTDLTHLRHHYDAIIFDIDGTLWNAAETTALAWTKVFEKHKIPIVVSKADIEGVAGRPYLDCLKIIFRDFEKYPHPEILLKDLTDNEQRMLKQEGADLYRGVQEGLSVLSAFYPLYLVSNCQAWYLKAFLDFQKLGQFFKDSTCFGITQMPKDKNLELMIKRNSLKNPVYLGDTNGDWQAAKSVGVDFIHLTYGFEPALPAPLRFSTFEEMVDYLKVNR